MRQYRCATSTEKHIRFSAAYFQFLKIESVRELL